MARKGAEGQKEIKKLVRQIRKQGYRLYRKGGHIRVVGPEGSETEDTVLVRISSTPDRLAIMSIKRDLRRAGIKVK